MFSSLYNKTPNSLSSILRNFCYLRILECTPVIITRSLSSAISSKKQVKQTSFIASYLINSCGLSPEDANVVSQSKRVKFETLDKPDSVLAIFHKYGFMASQIAKIVKSRPDVLSAEPKKTITSKLEFFSSIGIAGTDLAELISSNPRLLKTSLRNRIIPLYKLLKSTLPCANHIIVKAMSNASRRLVQEEARIRTNIAFLREIGMPETVIQQLVMHRFHLLTFKVDIFRNRIKKIIDMGFRPAKTIFIQALVAVLCFSESSWQRKVDVYRRFGWSEDEIMSAFQKFPQCMTSSEKKIIGSMNFLVNVMDFKASSVSAIPFIFSYSLEKRTIPRGLVVKTLVWKGVLTNDINFTTVLQKNDERFFKEYVEKHREQIPYLVDVFEGKISPQQLGFHL